MKCSFRTLLRQHLECLGKFFRVLAYEQPDFLAFPESDREVLLTRNTKLFIQYFLGRFFFAGSGIKQHHWLLLCQASDYLNDATFLRFIPITTFDGIVNLFRDKKAMARYETLAKEVSDISLHVHCNSVVALACLFHHEGLGGRLTDPARVERSRDWVYESAGYASDKFNCLSRHEMGTLMVALLDMGGVFEKAVDWREDGGGQRGAWQVRDLTILKKKTKRNNSSSTRILPWSPSPLLPPPPPPPLPYEAAPWAPPPSTSSSPASPPPSSRTLSERTSCESGSPSTWTCPSPATTSPTPSGSGPTGSGSSWPPWSGAGRPPRQGR